MAEKPETMDIEAADASGSKMDPSYHRGLTFSNTGMRITFKDLTFSVASNTKKGERAKLLDNVSGYFLPRQMAALMGPSGSGKTTLLDILAGRKNTGKLEGTILFAGQKPSKQFLRRYTGYVEQFDTLLGILTVYEMLLYTAELKRSVSEPLSSKKEAVEVLLGKLALETCRDVKIGSAMAKGISGGQAKRTNIGISLITNPRVLFLDEPTSGLDSYTANEVMTLVKTFTKEGVTICATIHSPSAYCFNLFDRMMMLVRGRLVYFGEQGQPAIDFVRSRCPQIKEMEAGYNDAEWLVDLFTEADRKGRGGEFADAYAGSELKKDNDRALEDFLAEKTALPPHVEKELHVKSETVTPWYWGLKTLIKYRTSRNYRDPEFLAPRVFDKVLMSLLIMTLYLGIGNDLVPSNAINIAAVLFMWCTLPAFGAAAYVPAIVLERQLFTRERNDGLYRVFTYIAAKMFDELIIAAIGSLAVAAWTFYGIQLQGSFFIFWITYYMTLSVGIVLAYAVAAISPNMDVANAALPTYVVTLLFFAGFLFRFQDMPPWWYWYSYIDFLKYSWGTLMTNQFGDGRDIPFADSTVLAYYSLVGINIAYYLSYLLCFFIFYTICAWLVMSYKKYQQR